MSNKFGRWLRSKSGMWTVIGIVAALLIVVIVGAILGWWQYIADLISGTVVTPPPPAHWDPPPGGYTCLPTCSETDGRFFSSVGSSMDSFTGSRIVVWIGVPGDYPSFTLEIFDGDSGKDAAGNVGGWWAGNWDETTDEVVYTLYADPLMDGAGTTMVGQWRGNQDPMPNNAWYSIPPITNVPAAMAPSGHYFYRLEAVRSQTNYGISAFKLRSNAYLMAGRSGLVDASFSVVAMFANWNDAAILWPQSGGLAGYPDNMGTSNYNGSWVFHLYVPTDTETLEFWDGDFDRGTFPQDNSADTDDPNTPPGPPRWAVAAQAERAGNVGSPPDDVSWFLWRVSPPVTYQIIDPNGVPIYTNAEPSGTEEWERFVLTTNADAATDADVVTEAITPGNYTIAIEGLDLHNTVWIRTNYTICPVERCPDVYDGGGCPRTIGYWKNNVNKVLIQGRTNGVQETPESIRHALDLIAIASPLYRHGINVNDPQPIATVARLTDQEANMILQRNQRSYPGGRTAANSMLARALQQNLATWLNVMSGKVSANAFVQLNASGGVFEGSVNAALLEAQTIILNASDPNAPALERAKDIGDLINNGLCGENCTLDLTCEDYAPVMPPDQQPPRPTEAPVAPTPVPPAPPVAACTGSMTNRYNVEITNNPFYGIKFNYQSGDLEIRDGLFDTFSFVLTADQVAAMTSIQLEAKAGQNQAQVTMEGCAFNQATTCGPIVDATNSYAFQFMGATDNGDGTYTLTFNVYNYTNHGLSHVTFGLPAGAVPTTPVGSYESVICP